MKNLLCLFIIFSANLAFAQKPDYNPNRDPIQTKGSSSGLQISPPTKGEKIICLCCNKDVKLKPLLVVNGEITSREDYKLMDPNRIKSITVLKDKKATDLYGEKGKNGVIVIEAKRNWKKRDNSDKKPPILAI